MKKQLLITLTFLAIYNLTFAQITYKDVAGIFYARCTSCHHNGASNFPFINYTQTAAMASSIQADLVSEKCPPGMLIQVILDFNMRELLPLQKNN